MNRRQLILLGTAAALVGPAVYSLTRTGPTPNAVLTLVSSSYRLDKIYRSMEGPWSIQKNIQLAPQPLTYQPSNPAAVRQTTNRDHAGCTTGSVSLNRFVWLTGIETQIVDANSETPVSQEFFCHANLTFSENHDARPDRTAERAIDSRLFTLAPGRTSIELPPGFGMPIQSNASLDYLTMSLNLNPRKDAMNVRMRTKLHTIAADQPGAPIKALFRRAVYVLQRESPSGTGGAEHKSCTAKLTASADRTAEPSGLGCGEWIRITLPNGSTAVMPSQGMANHWTVPEGDHIYVSDITPQLNLPFDTTIHYATIHVHPFALWMELRDLTAGKTILHLTSKDWPDRIGVAHVDEFKSIEGLPIVRDHHYELAVEYNNTSSSSTDAMAILYLYMLDKKS
jgi:hypothetical protein